MPLSYPLFLLPIIAAVIGYFTNWVAIKMLFRPLEEKRIFGIRVPFTPGVIPRRREEIAENIGDAVANNLLTDDAVERRIRSQDVRAKIDFTISNMTHKLLNKKWDSIDSMIPSQFSSEWDQIVRQTEAKIVQQITASVQNKRFSQLLENIIYHTLVNLKKKPLKDILDRETRDDIAGVIDRSIADYTQQERFEDQVNNFWETRIEKLFKEGQQVGNYVPSEIREIGYNQLDNILPPLLIMISNFLQNPSIRKKIKMHLFDLIDDLLEKEFDKDSVWSQLKLGFLETFVISVEKLKLRIDEAVDEGVPRLAELLERKDVREQIRESLTEYIEDLLEKDLSELDISDQRKRQMINLLTRITVSVGRNEQLRSVIMSFFLQQFEKIEHKSIEELFTGEEDFTRKTARKIKTQIVNSLQSPKTEKELKSLIHQKITEVRNRPFGPLDKFMKEEWSEAISKYAINQTINFLSQETPKIMATMDVAGLVKREVDKFSLLDVESLILDVTGNQLRAITWFGAVIGFLIGTVQIFILTFFG